MTLDPKGLLPLSECPIGLFLAGEELCLKTEYGNNEGRIDAYIVSSGEFFWGNHPQTIANQRAQMVRPIDPAEITAYLSAVPSDVAGLVERSRDEWRYDIQYGPEGEANYAWVYSGKEMVATCKTHHAIAIVNAMNDATAIYALSARPSVNETLERAAKTVEGNDHDVLWTPDEAAAAALLRQAANRLLWQPARRLSGSCRAAKEKPRARRGYVGVS